MLRTPSSAGTYTWPFQHGDGSQLEKMWSGPEPRACGVAAQTSGDRFDRSLVAGPVPQTTVGTATLKGCYKFSTSADSSDDTRPLAFAVSGGGMMTNQVGIILRYLCVGYKLQSGHESCYIEHNSF